MSIFSLMLCFQYWPLLVIAHSFGQTAVFPDASIAAKIPNIGQSALQQFCYGTGEHFFFWEENDLNLRDVCIIATLYT